MAGTMHEETPPEPMKPGAKSLGCGRAA